MRHADGGRPDLLRALGQPRQPGDPGLRPGARLGRPLRDERGDRPTTPTSNDGHARVDARARTRAAPAAASSSPTTRRSSRRSSRGTSRSRWTSRKSAKDPRRPGVAPRVSRRSPSTSTSRRHRTRRASRSPTSRSTSPTATRRPCACIAKRSLGDVELKYRINGGRVRNRQTRASGAAARRTAATDRRLLPHPPGHRPGARSRAIPSRCWFDGQGEAPQERVVHATYGPSRTTRGTRSSSSRPRTTRAPRRPYPQRGPGDRQLPDLLRGRPAGERHRLRRLRRRRERPQGARPPRRALATTRPSSGTRATTSSRGSRAGRPGTPPASP